MAIKQKTRARRLPKILRHLFWDHNFTSLSWAQDRDLVIRRVLASGNWQAVRWLRARLGDEALEQWLRRSRGRGLSRQQLRFWMLILGLPKRLVDTWLRDPRRRAWDRRVRS